MQIFMTVLIVLLCLGIFIPYLRTSLDIGGSSPDVDGFQATIEGSSYTSIALNLVGIPFWTFGLNYWINLIILLPLRIIGGISLWYIISPAK
jgi:hypothetical protein